MSPVPAVKPAAAAAMLGGLVVGRKMEQVVVVATMELLLELEVVLAVEAAAVGLLTPAPPVLAAS